MKYLKDINIDQMIEIAKLVYPVDLKNTDFYDFKYQPFDPSWFEDAREYAVIFFKAVTFGQTIDKIMVEIDVNLNVWLYYCRENGAHNLPTQNQYYIQDKFHEWGFVPKNMNSKYIRNKNLKKLL